MTASSNKLSALLALLTKFHSLLFFGWREEEERRRRWRTRGKKAAVAAVAALVCCRRLSFCVAGRSRLLFSGRWRHLPGGKREGAFEDKSMTPSFAAHKFISRGRRVQKLAIPALLAHTITVAVAHRANYPWLVVDTAFRKDIFPSLENPRLQFSPPLLLDFLRKMSVSPCCPSHTWVCLFASWGDPPLFCPSLSQGWRRQKNWKQPYLPFFGASRA